MGSKVSFDGCGLFRPFVRRLLGKRISGGLGGVFERGESEILGDHSFVILLTIRLRMLRSPGFLILSTFLPKS